MPRTKLTASQKAAKKRVEAQGGIFVPPSDYRSAHHRVGADKGKSAVAQRKAASRFAPLYDTLHPATSSLVDQILDPEDVNDAQRWPNQYGLSGLYKCKNVINAAFDSAGRSAVAVYPRLADAIFTTAGNAVSDNIADSNITNDPCPISHDLIDIKKDTGRFNYAAPIIFPNGHASLCSPSSQVNKLLYPIGLTPPAVLNNLQIKFVYGNGAVAGDINSIVTFYTSAFAVVQQVNAFADATGVATVIYGNAATTVAYMSIEIEPVYDLSAPLTIALESSTTGALWKYKLEDVAQHMIVNDLKDAGTFYSSAQKYNVISQSLLVTAQMSDTKNGGTLAIARLPGDTFPGEGDGVTETFDNWYEYIASLPYNSYDGPIKEGGYCWYLGEDERSYFYRDVRSPIDYHMPYMVAEFTAADATESAIVRLKITSVVQFTSTSSIFSMAPSEWIADWKKAHYLLSMVPAAYGNAIHKRMLKKHLKTIAGKLVNVLKNPKTYTTAAKIGGMLASVL